MDKQTTISIIVPIYNSEPYLDRCLASLEKQTYTGIEIWMIDDGSTDGSAGICRSYEARDPRFRYVRQENSGVSAARNRGLTLARGGYIGFCDSDDWAEPDMYECLHALITETEADVAIVGKASEQDAREDVKPPKPLLFNAESAVTEMHQGRLFQGQLWNKLMKAELIGDLRFREDVAIYEDMLFMWQILYRAKRIAFCDLPKYHYIANAASALRAPFKESYRTVQIACDEMLAYMQTHYPQHAPYAEATLLLGNYTLIEKLVQAKRLTSSEYRSLKAIIRPHYTNEVKTICDRHLCIHIACFLMGRLPYLCYHSLKQCYRKARRYQ